MAKYLINPIYAYKEIKENFILYVKTAFGTRYDCLEKEREEFLKGIISWADKNDIGNLFGTSDDNYNLCQYNIVADTAAMCKGYVSELKAKLKKQFPRIRLIYQGNGNVVG